MNSHLIWDIKHTFVFWSMITLARVDWNRTKMNIHALSCTSIWIKGIIYLDALQTESIKCGEYALIINKVHVRKLESSSLRLGGKLSVLHGKFRFHFFMTYLIPELWHYDHMLVFYSKNLSGDNVLSCLPSLRSPCMCWISSVSLRVLDVGFN